MARFTKEQRQEIVREFAVRHNGQYNAALFLEEVHAAGQTHPAYEWFQWDKTKAAREHQLWQAREFALGLKVVFNIQEIGRNKRIKIKTATMPMVISPAQGRGDGGGYVLSNPDDPEHVAELCRQAAVALRSWYSRYHGALVKAGGSADGIEAALVALESAASQKAAA